MTKSEKTSKRVKNLTNEWNKNNTSSDMLLDKSIVTGCNPNDLDIWTDTAQEITDRKQVVCRVVDHN